MTFVRHKSTIRVARLRERKEKTMCKMCETLKQVSPNYSESEEVEVGSRTAWLEKYNGETWLCLNDGTDHCAVMVRFCPFCGEPLDK